MEIKDVLKEYIDEKDADINFIAVATGITRQGLYKIKNGKVTPKVDSVKKICLCLNYYFGAKLDYKDFF